MPSLGHVCPDLPPGIIALVDSCCATNRNQRPANAQDFLKLIATMSPPGETAAANFKQPHFGLRLSSHPKGGIVEVGPYGGIQDRHEPMLRAIQPADSEHLYRLIAAGGSHATAVGASDYFPL